MFNLLYLVRWIIAYSVALCIICPTGALCYENSFKLVTMFELLFKAASWLAISNCKAMLKADNKNGLVGWVTKQLWMSWSLIKLIPEVFVHKPISFMLS